MIFHSQWGKLPMVSQSTGEVLAPLRPRRQSTGGAPEPRPGGGPGGDAGGPGRPWWDVVGTGKSCGKWGKLWEIHWKIWENVGRSLEKS